VWEVCTEHFPKRIVDQVSRSHRFLRISLLGARVSLQYDYWSRDGAMIAREIANLEPPTLRRSHWGRKHKSFVVALRGKSRRPT